MQLLTLHSNMYFKPGLIFSLLFFVTSLQSQTSTEELMGYYMSPGGNSIFKFYKEANKYYAKPVWMKRPSRLDTLNPDKSKHTRKILGSVLLWDFEFDGKNTWTNGHIYDANKGKTYKAKMSRDKKGNVVLRGYVGLRILGKTEYFVKVDFKE